MQQPDGRSPYAVYVHRASRLIAIVVLSLALGATWAVSGRAQQGASSPPPAAYWLGESFRGLPLTATSGSTYLYGDCEPGPDSGCAPPLQVQNYSACHRNPVGLDVGASRVHLLRGGAVAAAYPTGGVDLGTGRRTVTVFAPNGRLALDAARNVRRRSASQPPALYPPPRYPQPVLRELKRILVARERFPTIVAIARATGLPRGAVRTRLRLARLLEDSLAGVKAPTRSWRTIEHDRQISFEAGEFGTARTARGYGITRAQVRAAVRRVRGLAGNC